MFWIICLACSVLSLTFLIKSDFFDSKNVTYLPFKYFNNICLEILLWKLIEYFKEIYWLNKKKIFFNKKIEANVSKINSGEFKLSNLKKKNSGKNFCSDFKKLSNNIGTDIMKIYSNKTAKSEIINTVKKKNLVLNLNKNVKYFTNMLFVFYKVIVIYT